MGALDSFIGREVVAAAMVLAGQGHGESLRAVARRVLKSATANQAVSQACREAAADLLRQFGGGNEKA